MFKKILTVCVGNICRSPTAEYVFRHRLKGRGIQVESAGLGALVGKSMDATARQLLLEHDIEAGGHSARQLAPGMLREADLVFVMEKDHLHAVGQLAPEASGKVFLLDKWLNNRDIPDPYRQQRPAFEHVYTLIEPAVESWLRYL